MWLGMVAMVALAGKQPSKRPTDEARGKELYERHCVACHGPAAQGDGPAATALREPVPPVANLEVDKATIDVVTNGRNTMPAFLNSFDRNVAKRVLRHMARLPAEAEKAKADAEGSEKTGDDAKAK